MSASANARGAACAWTSTSSRHPLPFRHRPPAETVARAVALTLAWRNLAQDRIRFATTLAGVAFSVVLMAAQLALLLGFTATSSSLIDHANADFWVAAVGARNVDQSGDIPLRERYRALAVPGVADAASLVVRFAPWKRPDGGTETVIVVGIDLEHPGLVPWNFAAGNVDDLRRPDGIIIDALRGETRRAHVGDRWKFTATARVSSDLPKASAPSPKRPMSSPRREKHSVSPMRALTPAVISWYRRIRAPVSRCPSRARRSVPQSRRLEHIRLLWQTRSYWLFSTGAGAALVLAAMLGVIVGMIIVAQTLYASTMERLSEFATLRAMGAPAGYLYGIILQQGLMSAAIGFSIGLAVAQTIVHAAHDANAAMLLPLPLVAGLGVATVAMCAGAAITSIRRAVTAEPAMIFRVGCRDGPQCAFPRLHPNRCRLARLWHRHRRGSGGGSGDVGYPRQRITRAHGTVGQRQDQLASDDRRADPPSLGQILVDGRSINVLGERELGLLRLHKIGFIFQHYNLFRNLRAWENVAVAFELLGLTRRACERGSRALLERMGIAHRAEAFPHELSGGQRQRVAIARALAGDPFVLLADEPTAALDTQSGERIGQLLRDLAHQDGRAVVIVTHDRRLAAHADRMVLLADGRIVPADTPAPQLRMAAGFAS